MVNPNAISSNAEEISNNQQENIEQPEFDKATAYWNRMHEDGNWTVRSLRQDRNELNSMLDGYGQKDTIEESLDEFVSDRVEIMHDDFKKFAEACEPEELDRLANTFIAQERNSEITGHHSPEEIAQIELKYENIRRELDTPEKRKEFYIDGMKQRFTRNLNEEKEEAKARLFGTGEENTLFVTGEENTL